MEKSKKSIQPGRLYFIFAPMLKSQAPKIEQSRIINSREISKTNRAKCIHHTPRKKAESIEHTRYKHFRQKNSKKICRIFFLAKL